MKKAFADNQLAQPYQSNALWPAGVCSTMYGDDISTDRHRTKQEAEAVCRALHREGFGGDRQHHPLMTWVSEVQDPPCIPASHGEPRYFQRYGEMNAIKDALRPGLKEGDMLIWRDAFRWKNDNGVLPNHFECMDLAQLCDDFDYDVVHDFCDVAVVRKR